MFVVKQSSQEHCLISALQMNTCGIENKKKAVVWMENNNLCTKKDSPPAVRSRCDQICSNVRCRAHGGQGRESGNLSLAVVIDVAYVVFVCVSIEPQRVFGTCIIRSRLVGMSRLGLLRPAAEPPHPLPGTPLPPTSSGGRALQYIM